ncbi:hypothetical protein CVT25_009254 [Psilocybe cyanescens]|uniref:Nephrocystin 3-like N-terminal domain-containing protein n=1 Tax=Psilocybe cyanescens TaxID=93625 RepID=A0A409XTG1_PSICY|nr:hypothetical protein CVT25_009254 [Psilocybe cyanescens]
MFRTANNVFINGGAFTVHNQHNQGTPFTVRSMSNSWLRLKLLTSQFAFLQAIDRLMEAASLGALHNSGERFDPPKCHPNTRTAVLQKLMDWFIGEFGWDNFVLWLYGPAGAGKSAIAQTFAELCAKKNCLLASFFFSRSDLRRNNEKAFVATLAYQLWLRIPESRPIIEAVINDNPAIFQLNFDTQFCTLFLNPLLQLSRDGRFISGIPFPNLIIIDGLDECNGADVQNTISNTISNALQHHPSALPFRILIASRPEYHLTTSFSVAPLHSLTFRLALDDTYQPDEDIRLYLTDSFRDIRNAHIMRAHLPDSWPSGEDVTKLVAKSSGQFIYATMVIRYVSSPQCNPLDRLKVIQGLLPVNDDRPYAQLDALYVNILSGVKDVEAVLRILGVAFVLTKINYRSIGRLGVNKLEEFMQLTPGTVQLLLIDLLSVVDASDNNKPIKFLHASFSDFLLDPTRSRQFFIDPSKRHGDAAYFCISAIESLNMTTSLPKLAYRSLLSHLHLAGPLHDNATLREKVFKVPYVQHWPTFALALRDDVSSLNYLGEDPGMFLEFLQTSEFRQTEELYLHHRGILDQKLREDLALIPMSPCLAFWTALSAGGILESNGVVSLETFCALSDSLADDLTASVPGFLFSALFDQIEVGSEQRRPAWYHLYRITGTPYLRMVREFLNDASRAGPYAVDESTYTQATVFAVEFAVMAWDETKSTSGEHWGLIWDAFAFMLSKAGYSAELVNLLSQQNLTFNLVRPGTNVCHRVQTLFGAVRNYLLKFNGSSPSPFKIIINWTECPSDYVGNRFAAHDLDDNSRIRRIIYVDESIRSSVEDMQGLAGKKRTAL